MSHGLLLEPIAVDHRIMIGLVIGGVFAVVASGAVALVFIRLSRREERRAQDTGDDVAGRARFGLPNK